MLCGVYAGVIFYWMAQPPNSEIPAFTWRGGGVWLKLNMPGVSFWCWRLRQGLGSTCCYIVCPCVGIMKFIGRMKPCYKNVIFSGFVGACPLTVGKSSIHSYEGNPFNLHHPLLQLNCLAAAGDQCLWEGGCLFLKHPDWVGTSNKKLGVWKAGIVKNKYIPRCCMLKVLSWNSKQPFINGCLVISNHFPCKDSWRIVFLPSYT